MQKILETIIPTIAKQMRSDENVSNIIAKSKKKRSFYENLNLFERYDIPKVYGMSRIYDTIR